MKKNDIPCSLTGRLNVVQMSIFPNLIYRFDTIQVKIPGSYFVDIDQLIVTFVWQGKSLESLTSC